MGYLLNLNLLKMTLGGRCKVLNLIINGLPSKLMKDNDLTLLLKKCFKPYYKWITF